MNFNYQKPLLKIVLLCLISFNRVMLLKLN